MVFTVSFKSNQPTSNLLIEFKDTKYISYIQIIYKLLFLIKINHKIFGSIIYFSYLCSVPKGKGLDRDIRKSRLPCTFNLFSIFINMKYYIYKLSHPISNEVRYVGKTINIKRRYKQHLYDKRGSHKSNWVQSLRKQKLKPILTILEECNNNWQDREIYWINQFDNLTNFLSGGQNSYRPPTSEETKEKIRQANIGKKLSKNHKNNISLKMKKKRISIKGVIYESFSIANNKTGINLSTLHYRINNPKINDYFYV